MKNKNRSKDIEKGSRYWYFASAGGWRLVTVVSIGHKWLRLREVNSNHKYRLNVKRGLPALKQMKGK